MLICSSECQRLDRQRHKGECKRWKLEKEAARERELEREREEKDTSNAKKGKAKEKGDGKSKKPNKTPDGGGGGGDSNSNSNRSNSKRRPAVDPNVSFGADGDCPICLCKFVDPVRLPCGHHLCAGCLKELRKYRHLQESTCPTCRGQLPPGGEKMYEERWVRWWC